MSDLPPNDPTIDPRSANAANDPAHTTPAPAPAPKRKKKRWWLRILLALIIIIVLLVACAPYIASTGPVRSIVVGKVNENLNGSIAIDDYSVGWTGGITASGIKVYDAQKVLMLEVPRLSTKLSLIGAMRGNLDLGDTQMDVNLTDVRVDKDGKVNLAELAKKNPPATETKTHHDASPAPAQPQQATDVPNVKGKITVNVLGGKISGEGVPTTVNVAPSTVVLDIPDINQPIKNDIKLAYQVGTGKPSTFGVTGTIDAIQNSKLDVAKLQDTLVANQKVSANNVDLAALAPFMKLGPDAVVGGIMNGNLDVAAKGYFGINANGEFVVTDAVYTGGAVKDRLVIDRIAIPIQVTTSGADANSIVVRIDKLGIESPLLEVSLVGNVPQTAIQNLAKNLAPGADGQLTATVIVRDLSRVSAALPRTLDLSPDVKVTGGAFQQTTRLNIAKDGVTLDEKVDLSADGQRAGRPIKLTPVHLETGALAVMNGTPMPNIRDIQLKLMSGFISINGGGATLGNLSIDGNFDLNKLQNEVAQFSDLGGMKMAGTGNFNVKTNGDLTAENAPVQATLAANLASVRVEGAAGQPIDVSRLALNAGGTVNRANGAVSTISDGRVTLQTGDEKAPLVNVAATGSYDMGTKLAAFDLANFAIDKLEEVQRQYGALVPALKDIQIQSGAVYAKVTGTWDGNSKTLTLTKPLGLSMPNIVVNKGGRQVFGREDITATVNGTFVLADQTHVMLSELALGTKSNLFAVNKTGDKPIDVTLAGSGIKGSGTLDLAADLKRLSDLAKAFGTEVEAKNQSGEVQRGNFKGTLALAQGEKQTDVNFDGKITELSVTTSAKPIQNETVTITLRANSPTDFSAVNVASANIESRFASAKVTDAVVKLSGGPLDMVQKAVIEAHVPELPAVKGLLDAFQPPVAAPQARVASSSDQPIYLTEQDAPKKKKKKADVRENASGEASAPAPLEPLQFTSGSADLKLNVSRDSANAMIVKLTETKVSKLALARGTRQYAFPSDINVALDANVASNNGQISSATVNQLNGDLGGVAKLSMPEAIKVTGSMDQPAVNGTIKLDGTLDAAVPLLSVLQGAEPLPYRGDFSTTQKVSSSADGMNLGGTLTSTRFAMLDSAGKVAFEDSIDAKNDIGLLREKGNDKQNLTIRALSLTLPKSNAVGLNLGGRIFDIAQNRTLKDVKLDLTYDLATLWKIVFPMLSPEMREQYKDMKVAGKATKTFNVSGAFPSRPTVYESLRSLNADGGFSLELADLPQGITAQMIDLLFELKGGVLTTKPGKVGPRPPTPEDSHDAKANGSGLAGLLGGGGDEPKRRATDEPAPKKRGGTPPAPADLKPESGYANTGALNLAGITIDLTSPNMPVSIPKNKKLLQNVRLNPVLAGSLGKTGAILFVGNDTAEGLVNLTVAECNRVPIGDLTARDRHANATLILNVEGLKLSGAITSVLAQALGADSITGRIPDSTVTIANGAATTNLTVLIDKQMKDDKGRERLIGQPIKFNGGVDLTSLAFRNFVVEVSPELLIGELRKYAPNGAVFPLTGTANSPHIDYGKFIADNAVKGLIPGIGGDKKDGKDGGKNGDPIGDILDKLGGKDKDKKDKKKGGK